MRPASPSECLEAQKKVSAGFDDALKKVLESRAHADTVLMYQMLQYFMGFLDAGLQPEESGAGGKRFRPSLCLFIAEAYGARDKVMDAALAIELFHNFTLVHDDVEDRDEMRRNRPTVWKLWGVNHAINSGDALLLLTSELALKTGPVIGLKLLTAFQEVMEGQYLDFELADNPLESELVSEENALLMDAKKTGALVAVAAEVAGIAGLQSAEECASLHGYGMAIGMVFQLADDYRSVWGTKKDTGKDLHSDIREHKRTLPFFAARQELTEDKKKRLDELYSLTRQLSEKEIAEALALINTTHAKESVLALTREHAEKAKELAASLSVSDETKSILMGIADMLVPQD